MVVGVVIDGQGRPLCCELWPGNVTDVKTWIPVVDRWRQRFRIRTICVVADGGMISKETIAQLQDNQRDLNALQKVEVQHDEKRFRLRREMEGSCGAVFHAAGVAIPPTWPKLHRRNNRPRLVPRHRCVAATPGSERTCKTKVSKTGTGIGSGVLRTMVFVRDIVAIASLLLGRGSVGHKVLLILLMPCIGVVLYFLVGRSPADVQRQMPARRIL